MAMAPFTGFCFWAEAAAAAADDDDAFCEVVPFCVWCEVAVLLPPALRFLDAGACAVVKEPDAADDDATLLEELRF